MHQGSKHPDREGKTTPDEKGRPGEGPPADAAQNEGSGQPDAASPGSLAERLGELTPEEYSALLQKAEERELFRKELQRERADFSNYQKRVLRDRPQIEEQAVRRFVLDLLPVIDNVDRALAQDSAEAGTLREGIRLVRGMLREALARHGIEEVEALGKPFDPFLHEAVSHEATSSFPPETVSEVLEKGYTHRGAVLRAAKVKVARAPADVGARSRHSET